MAYQISQISLFADILKLLTDKHGVANEDSKPRYLNAVIKAANIIVDEFGRDDRYAKDGEGLQAWLASDDTGASSLFMARTLGPLIGERVRNQSAEVRYPHDPEDFGRCLRLLKAAPALREHLGAMAPTHNAWWQLVENWAELEALYNEELPSGNAPKLYARMKALGC